MRLKILGLAAALMLAMTGFSSARAETLINGAGSTFGYPIYSKWFDAYAKSNPGIHFNYQSIGSGGGIKMLMDKTVEIGASDAPLSDEQLAKAPAPVLHFPSVLGAVVITYNVPNVSKKLRLTGPVVADIYLGKIKKWDDAAIAKLNPGVKLPDTDIVTVHRSDGSGTTFIFADYLSKVSPEWAKQVGKSTSLKWPGGLGGKGSEGVTALVQQTQGAIGYVELTYALTNKISYAQLKNHDGKWVDATLDGVTAAAAGAAANMPSDFRVSIVDAPGARAYPISSFTWLIVYQNQADPTRGPMLTKFLKWALTDGQSYASPLDYAPLPKEVADKELQKLSEIKVAGEHGADNRLGENNR
jgi:phosphate transport system substrate-binding protein